MTLRVFGPRILLSEHACFNFKHTMYLYIQDAIKLDTSSFHNQKSDMFYKSSFRTFSHHPNLLTTIRR